jgi:hypothetical protein
VLIGIDENGSRVITSNEDPLFKTEVVAFLRHFSMLLYNFDPATYLENVGSASELMSANLWEDLETLLRKKQDIVKSNQISHSGIVESIVRLEPSLYEVVLKCMEQRKIKKIDRYIKVQIRLRRIERSGINPWGIEIDELQEIPM